MSLTVSQSVASTDSPSASSSGQSGLVYDLNTDPDPLRVSPAQGALERGDIVIVASAMNFNPIDVRRITVGFPVGPHAHSLTEHLEQIEATLNQQGTSWTPSHDPQEQQIVFTPPGGSAVIDPGSGATIQLRNIPVNRAVGTVPLNITVSWRRGNAAWKDDIDLLSVGKFPPDFRLSNLKAAPLTLEHSGSVTLTWEASSGATYRLLYGTAEVDVTDVRTYTVNNLRQTTPFYLRGIAQSGNSTVERTLTAMVTVTVPDLEVTNLYVRGNLNARMMTNMMRTSYTTADGWGPSVPVNLHSGITIPGMAVHNDRLYCVHTPLIGDRLQWSVSNDGIDWRAGQPFNARSYDAPALASAGGLLHCVYRTPDDALHHTTFKDEVWSPPVPIGERLTTHAPALATMVDGTTLVCVYRGTDGILYYIVYDGSTWSGGENHYVRRERSITGPGMTAGIRGDLNVVWCTHQSEDGGWWQNYYQGGYSPGWPGAGYAPTERSQSAKACATYDRRLNLVHRREDGYYLQRSAPGGTGTEVPMQRMAVSNHTAAAPVLITYDNALHMYYMR